VQVFLIRHPRPLLAAGVCYGQLDVDCEDPLPVASRLRPLLPNDTRVIASPLRRTRSLAEALHPAPIFDARLMEINFGDWEGKQWADIDRKLIDAWAADLLNFVPPGGESVAMLQARAVDCVAGLNEQRIALVTHGGVIRALLGHWAKLPVEEWSQLKLAFGGVTVVDIDDANRGGKAVFQVLDLAGAADSLA
jgi:alpha-ribazole phosphatase